MQIKMWELWPYKSIKTVFGGRTAVMRKVNRKSCSSRDPRQACFQWCSYHLLSHGGMYTPWRNVYPMEECLSLEEMYIPWRNLCPMVFQPRSVPFAFRILTANDPALFIVGVCCGARTFSRRPSCIQLPASVSKRFASEKWKQTPDNLLVERSKSCPTSIAGCPGTSTYFHFYSSTHNSSRQVRRERIT